MLKRLYRLSANTRLHHLFTYHSQLYMVKYTANDLPYSRFGFIVRKMIDKRATVRNRIRRVFRSCIEDQFEMIVPGQDMLFLLKPSIIGKERSDICREIEGFMFERSLFIKKERQKENLKSQTHKSKVKSEGKKI